MVFGGLQKTTLVDYPGKVAATIFTLGCNFHCPFCHNPELVVPELIVQQPKILEEDVLNFLKEKQGLLEGICITGGEPTLHSDLNNFLQKVKNLGYSIKLDSNGSNPQVLQDLIQKGLVDYVAMDIKTSPEKYSLVTLNQVSWEVIQESIQLLKNSKIDYEFRTTVVPEIVNEDDIFKIVKIIQGAPKYYLQRFKSGKVIDARFNNLQPFDEQYLLNIISKIKPFFRECELR